MPRRAFALAALLTLTALPAGAQDAGALRLTCRADDPARLAEPLNFTIDFRTRQAQETGSGDRFGVTVFRDGLGLWDAVAGPGQARYRIDQMTGRFARMDPAGRLDGRCERATATP